MLAAVGVDALDTLIDQNRAGRHPPAAPLALGEPTAEHVALARLKAIAGKNVLRSPSSAWATTTPSRPRSSCAT
jgi:glycine dehydrogenase